MQDLMSKITAPIGEIVSTPTPAATPTPETAEKDLLAGEPPPPSRLLEVGENDLLGVQPAQPAQPPQPEQPEQNQKRKRGRPFGSKNPPKNNGSPTLETPSPSNVPNIADFQVVSEVVNTDYQLLAETTFDGATGLAASFVGPEWAARNEAERAGVVTPLAAYMKHKQMTDLPPGAVLAVAIIAYSAPRLREPATASKLAKLMTWFKGKFVAFFYRNPPHNQITP